MNFNEGAYIYINKPYRMSSFGALAHIRYVVSKRLKVKRVKMGHAGTLDPLATGVLILCTGKATKQIERLQQHTKEYTATLQLGATTPSYDLEHEVDQTYPTAHITRALIEQTLKQFVGDIMQVPPLFSACKVGGDRAYELARQGSDHQLAAKPVHIDEIELLECGLPQEPTLAIRVVCSKGTYIRALARDIGEALGSGAHLTALRRTRIGDIGVNQCMSVDGLLELLDTEEMVSPDRAEQERLELEREHNRAMARARKAEREAQKRARKPRQSQL